MAVSEIFRDLEKVTIDAIQGVIIDPPGALHLWIAKIQLTSRMGWDHLGGILLEMRPPRQVEMIAHFAGCAGMYSRATRGISTSGSKRPPLISRNPVASLRPEVCHVFRVTGTGILTSEA